MTAASASAWVRCDEGVWARTPGGGARMLDVSRYRSFYAPLLIPLAWLLFAGGLVVWGAYYLWTYSPALGGWSQGQALADEATLPGTTIFATVLFTVLAALVAGGILFTVALRKKE